MVNASVMRKNPILAGAPGQTNPPAVRRSIVRCAHKPRRACGCARAAVRFVDVHRPWRKVRLTERRTARDYAQCLRDLVDIDFPDADKIRVVRTTCRPIPPEPSIKPSRPQRPRRILRRLEFHYVPKHASWLNMVEIEIGVLRGQCLDRRIDDPKRLASEIAAWERQRNAAKARINWMFTTEKARAKRPLTPTCPKSHNHRAEVLARVQWKARSRSRQKNLGAGQKPSPAPRTPLAADRADMALLVRERRNR